MKSLVVDASVILAVSFNGPEKKKLARVTRGVSLLAPFSMKWEIGNALSVMFKRKRLSLEQAEKVWELCMNIPVQYIDIDPIKSLEICFKGDLYAYDAYMILCCLEKKTGLLTLDNILIKKAKQFGVESEKI